MTPNIIDVEASGFGDKSYPIEVGVVKSNGERFCCLIKPDDTWSHWDISAEAVHGISRDLLVEKGVSIRSVCETLNHFLHDESVYSDAWVVDKPWMTKLFFTAGVQMTFRISALELILNEAQMDIWDHTKAGLYAGQSELRHRASFDAAIIQSTFLRTAKLCQARLKA